jgi:hypothetical protein
LARWQRALDIGLVALLALHVMTTVAFAWQRPPLLMALLSPVPLLLAWRLCDPRRALALALTGLLLGPSTEMLCVVGGLWRYADTGGMELVPYWIFPVWVGFPLALWLVARGLFGSRPPPRWRPRTLAWALGLVALEIGLFVALGHSTPLALCAAVPMAAAVLWLGRSRETLAFFVAGAVLGPQCESLAVAHGAWSYRLPELLGMPAWLPLGYAIFGVLVGTAGGQAAALFGSSPR